ncbi:hypothetical protein Pam5_26 [Pseudanabaena phage Pam5]|nr:hypothetical protein Pam5_26 [Pseudanabaena phage Pam5]
MGKLNQRLLDRAVRIAKAATVVQGELTAAFEERYGLTYSEVDCDALIDVLDYGGGARLTVADCDREMLLCGVSPRSTASMASCKSSSEIGGAGISQPS